MQICIETRDGAQVPVLSGESSASGPVVGSVLAVVVRTLHEATIDAGLEQLAIGGLTRETLEPVLTYCAERRCIADNASCSGCRRRTDARGIASLDQFVAAHGEVVIDGGRMRLSGQGVGTYHAESLDQLAATWPGEELWFYARRVIRKLRYGTREKTAPRPAALVDVSRPAIVLVEPQLADNVGMVARAMANFSIAELRLVAPRDGWPNERARIAASGATFVVDDAAVYPTFEAALGDLNYVVATTARQRDLTKPVLTPEQAVTEMRSRIAAGQRCGIVFGRERNGLESNEVAIADAIVMVPVDPRFASLNLAQSVLVLAYEWMKQSGGGTLGRVTTYETPVQPGLNQRGFGPATRQDMLGFFEHLEGELDRLGFFGTTERRPIMVQNLRTMFLRLGATEQEVRTLRGIVKALVYGKGTGRRA